MKKKLEKNPFLSSESSQDLSVLQQPINTNLALFWHTGERIIPSSDSSSFTECSSPSSFQKQPCCQRLFPFPKGSLNLGFALVFFF